MGVIMQMDEGHRVIIAKNIKCLIGVDEAGRGALAGPVAVGAVKWERKDWPMIKKILKDYPAGKDSKKLTAAERDFWFEKIAELKNKSLIDWEVAFSSNKLIDQRGISWAIKRGIKKCLNNFLSSPAESLVLLDGSLRAPAEWINQQTIIKGDEKELIISLASIVAKVSRDSAMVKLTKKYPNHDLDKHKGYGTKKHYEKIEQFGVLVIHRLTYIAKIS